VPGATSIAVVVVVAVVSVASVDIVVKLLKG
jgi:hypothetical protein